MCACVAKDKGIRSRSHPSNFTHSNAIKEPDLPSTPLAISPTPGQARRDNTSFNDNPDTPAGNEETIDFGFDSFDIGGEAFTAEEQASVRPKPKLQSPFGDYRPSGRRTKARPPACRLAPATVLTPPVTSGVRLSPGQVLQHTFRLDNELFAFDLVHDAFAENAVSKSSGKSAPQEDVRGKQTNKRSGKPPSKATKDKDSRDAKDDAIVRAVSIVRYPLVLTYLGQVLFLRYEIPPLLCLPLT